LGGAQDCRGVRLDRRGGEGELGVRRDKRKQCRVRTYPGREARTKRGGLSARAAVDSALGRIELLGGGRNRAYASTNVGQLGGRSGHGSMKPERGSIGESGENGVAKGCAENQSKGEEKNGDANGGGGKTLHRTGCAEEMGGI